MDQRSDDAPCQHKVAFVSLEPGEGMGRGLHTEESGKERRTLAESCLGREEIQGGNVTKGKMRQKSDLEIIQRPLSGVVGTQPGWSGAVACSPVGPGKEDQVGAAR